MSEPIQPAYRTDEVGLLLRQLIGDGETPPDPTAAVPLVDALLAQGQNQMAFLVQDAVQGVWARLDSMPSPSRRIDTSEIVHQRLSDALGHLLYDFGLVCLALAARVQSSVQREQVQVVEQKAEVFTVKMTIPDNEYVPSLMDMMQLPDGRNGMVVRVDGRDVYILPMEQDYPNMPEGADLRGYENVKMSRPMRARR